MRQTKYPLISCVCITRDKPDLLKMAIQCFADQTYPNKELVILYEDNDPATGEMLASVRDERIRSFEIPARPKLSLGSLRNLSIELCDGEYFCQWDDDDWYHASRLEMQLDTLQRTHKHACYLPYWLIYNRTNGDAYLSIGPWAGSLLCRKSILTEELKYPDLCKDEDFIFLKQLMSLRYVFPLIMPSLYIYTYHGNNTCDKEHFQKIFDNSAPLSGSLSRLICRTVNGQVSHAEASRILLGREAMAEMDYFYYAKAELPEPGPSNEVSAAVSA